LANQKYILSATMYFICCLSSTVSRLYLFIFSLHLKYKLCKS